MAGIFSKAYNWMSDVGKVFQTDGNVFQIAWNKFYDWNNEIPMKIPRAKRSGFGIIVEFHRILTGFPNQV
jgi:hypothetical protein